MTATNVSCFITSRRGRRYSQIKIVVCSLALFDQNPSQSAKPENNHASGLKAVWHGSKFLELASRTRLTLGISEAEAAAGVSRYFAHLSEARRRSATSHLATSAWFRSCKSTA
jgi:hypothetical protein